jgi:hypothetical protein
MAGFVASTGVSNAIPTNDAPTARGTMPEPANRNDRPDHSTQLVLATAHGQAESVVWHGYFWLASVSMRA